MTTPTSQKGAKLKPAEIVWIQQSIRKEARQKRARKKQAFLEKAKKGVVKLQNDGFENKCFEFAVEATLKHELEAQKAKEPFLFEWSKKLERAGCLISVLALVFSFVTTLIIFFK